MKRLLALTLLAVAGLTGCGGGDDRTSATDYRAQARSICVDSARATKAIKQPTRSTPAAIADYLTRLLRTNERTVRRFRRLDPPARLQRPHDEILKANEDGARTVRRIIGDLKAGKDPRRVLLGATSTLRRLGERSNAAARRLGVPECVQ
jgi:hypothetical protein